MKTSKFILLFLTGAFSCASVIAYGAQQNLGDFRAHEARNINVGCGRGEIKSITFTAQKHGDSNCNSGLTIDSVALSYNAGFQQLFEFPAGSTLTSASFNVLPGNKCLSGLSARIKNRQAGCEGRIRVTVDRKS